MIVCICNAIKEEELREVARHGVTCPREAYAILGKQPDCGICLEHADDVLTEERMASAPRCARRDDDAPVFASA